MWPPSWAQRSVRAREPAAMVSPCGPQTRGRAGPQKLEEGEDPKGADQSDRHVALRVLGLLGGGGDRVEADVGEEDRGGRAQHARPARAQRVAPALGGEGGEVVWV